MKEQADKIMRIRTLLKENMNRIAIDDIAKKMLLNRTSTAKYLISLYIRTW